MLIGFESKYFGVLQDFEIGVTARELDKLTSELQSEGTASPSSDRDPSEERRRRGGHCERHPAQQGAVRDRYRRRGDKELRGYGDGGKVAYDVAPYHDPDQDLLEPDDCPRSLRHLTGFVGRNSTGKSAVFEALDFMADCLRYNVQYASSVKGRTGFSSLRTFSTCKPIELTAHCLMHETAEVLSWTIVLDCDRHGRPHLVAESVIGHSCTKRFLSCLDLSDQRSMIKKGLDRYPERRVYLDVHNGSGVILAPEGTISTEVNDVHRTALSVYGVIRRFKQLGMLFDYISRWFFFRVGKEGEQHPDALRMQQVYRAQLSTGTGGGHKHLDEFGQNVDNVLTFLKDQNSKLYQQTMRRIASKMPGTGRLNRRQLLNSLSSGEGRLFLYLLLLEDPAPRPLIMLENPDTGLFHEMIESLSAAMREYTLTPMPHRQILFTTHNTILLDMLSPDEVWNFSRDDEVVDFTDVFDSFDEEPSPRTAIQAACVASSPVVTSMYHEGIGMGSLWYSGHLEIKRSDQTGKLDVGEDPGDQVDPAGVEGPTDEAP